LNAADPRPARLTRFLPFALLALLVVTLLPGLTSVDAIDEREARDLLTAHESTQEREWLTTIYGHEPFFEKPLPGYTPDVLAQHVARRWPALAPGERGELALSRALRALLAIALAFAVAAAGARVFGARTGWLAGCALASMAGLPIAARADGGQLYATLLAWLGIGAWLDVLAGRARRTGLSVALGWLAFGATAAVGGPLPALWPLAGFGAYFALARHPGGWRKLDPVGGVLLLLGAGVPWYAIEGTIHGAEFLRHVPWFPYASGTRGEWYAAAPLALSFAVVASFPWTPLFAAALADATLRLRRAARPAVPDTLDPEHVEHLLLALAVAAAGAIAFYPGPPLTAALPVLPAVALLVGRIADRAIDGESDARALTHAARWLALIGSVFAAAGMTLSARLPDATESLRLLSIVVMLGSWAPLLADLRGARRLAVGLFALPAAIGAPVLHVRVLPELEPWLNAHVVAQRLEQVSPPDAALIVWEPPPPSLRRALPRNFLQLPQAGPAARLAIASDGWVYAAWRPSREAVALEGIAAVGDEPDVLARTPVLVLARFRPRA
jgi:4-amino-4-deoxy-L-arabinose transferase-like glycosyltransferase